MARSRLNQYVSQETAARIWLLIIGGRDEKLPQELVVSPDNKEKRKRDEKAEGKILLLQPEEEEKEGPKKR